MDIRGTPHLVHLSSALPETRLLRVPHAHGHRITSLSGDIWVTEQGRPQDIILRPGESVTLQSPGTALVMAFGSADIEVVPPPAREDLTAAWVDVAENFERYDHAARRLRAEAFREITATVACKVRYAARRIAAFLGAAVAPTDPCRGTA